MDITTILVGEIVKALQSGDLTKLAGYALIFIFLWIEVRGLKQEVKKLNNTIGESFKKGEDRFTKIEGRLTDLEKKQPEGGRHEEPSFI